MKKIFSTIAAAAALIFAVSCNSNSASVDLGGPRIIISVDGVAVNDTLVQPEFQFNAAEKLYHVKPGVNLINGSYTLEGDVITFGDGAMTRMMGPEELMAVEQSIVEQMLNPLTVKYENEVLSFTDEAGKVVLELKK